MVVSLTEPISSATANVNDAVAIVVKKPVVVNGWVVVPAGASGHATVTEVTHASGNGSGGKISLSVDWVYSSDGGMLQLSTTDHASESGDSKGAASTATLLSSVLLGPVGFFAHNFVRGRDVTIGTDKIFTAFVDHDAHVRTSQRAGQPEQFDQSFPSDKEDKGGVRAAMSNHVALEGHSYGAHQRKHFQQRSRRTRWKTVRTLHVRSLRDRLQG